MKRPRVAILVGPRSSGSNMARLIQCSEKRSMIGRVTLVIEPASESPAGLRARQMGIQLETLGPLEGDYGAQLLRVLHQHRIDWICLSGYLRLLPEEVLSTYRHRVLNIHPALLPRHGGKGMYGRRVHESVLAAGDAESGCTVHYVEHEYDSGLPILQLRCPVEEGDTADTLAARVLKLEHEAYPRGLDLAILHETRRNA